MPTLSRFLRPTAWILVGSLFLISCGDEDATEEGYFDDEGVEINDTALSDEVAIVPGDHGSDVSGVTMQITSPAAGEVITGDSITVSADLTDWELGSPTQGEMDKGIAFSRDGQHIHVIIDDEPYMAMYDPQNFPVGDLAEGAHTLRAFPSRSWHESVKSEGAFVAHTFYVGSKTGEAVLEEGKPLLTYSRPKGDYKGADADRILLDFYVTNATLGPDGHRVVATINGETSDTLTEWKPYYITGLGAGEHSIRLQLIGADGNPVTNGPFNDVTRTITVTQ